AEEVNSPNEAVNLQEETAI
nr:NAD(P)H-plastoquinone-oxidoreductase 21 kda polypeptide {N-terminal} [Synechocystis, PCC6803, Peptide Partial, 19 aa] [Synechocystis]